MSYIKKSLDIVVFGGGGFIGSAILREAAKRSLSIIPVGRNVSTTNLKCNKVHVGNALDPSTYDDLLETTKCVVVTIGSPPLPWPLNPLSKEEIIKNLPQKIGVYKFFDSTNKIIYVGKAKNLRKRVGSYFSIKTSGKTLRLVNKIDDVKYILVQNELDALLLENNLIKKYQPKYNVLMKDDKSYPWIKITRENFPKILFTRKVVNDGSDYFGPYKSTYVINVLIDLFYDMFYDSGWTPITLLKNKVNSQKNEKYQEIIKKIKCLFYN